MFIIFNKTTKQFVSKTNILSVGLDETTFEAIEVADDADIPDGGIMDSVTDTGDIVWVPKPDDTQLSHFMVIDGIWTDVKSDDEKWNTVRSARDFELKLTDWTQVPDSPLSTELKLEYSNWRQQLRDLPQEHLTPIDAWNALTILIAAKPQ